MIKMLNGLWMMKPMKGRNLRKMSLTWGHGLWCTEWTTHAGNPQNGTNLTTWSLSPWWWREERCQLLQERVRGWRRQGARSRVPRPPSGSVAPPDPRSECEGPTTVDGDLRLRKRQTLRLASALSPVLPECRCRYEPKQSGCRADDFAVRVRCRPCRDIWRTRNGFKISYVPKFIHYRFNKTFKSSLLLW